MTVSYTEYNKELMAFVQKHNKKAECKIETSPMENNIYYKNYYWSDGAAWSERTELVSETVEIEKHGLTFKAEIECWKTEFWSTESGSKYFYCK